MRKIRSFTGNEPVGDDWELVAGDIVDDDAPWAVWARTRDADKGWVGFKLVCEGIAKAKANYWISFGPGCNGRGRDLEILKENRPNLFKLVDPVFRKEYATRILPGH